MTRGTCSKQDPTKSAQTHMTRRSMTPQESKSRVAAPRARSGTGLRCTKVILVAPTTATARVLVLNLNQTIVHGAGLFSVVPH